MRPAPVLPEQIIRPSQHLNKQARSLAEAFESLFHTCLAGRQHDLRETLRELLRRGWQAAALNKEVAKVEDAAPCAAFLPIQAHPLLTSHHISLCGSHAMQAAPASGAGRARQRNGGRRRRLPAADAAGLGGAAAAYAAAAPHAGDGV